MAKRYKIILILISVVVALAVVVFLLYMHFYTIGLEKSLQWLKDNKCLTYTGEITNPLIKYDILSDEYKALFSENELNNASDGEEIYNIYTKVNSIGYGVKTTDMDCCVTEDKNYLNGRLYTRHGNYYVEYNIWFRPRPFTSDTEIVKWTVDMKEIAENPTQETE